VWNHTLSCCWEKPLRTRRFHRKFRSFNSFDADCSPTPKFYTKRRVPSLHEPKSPSRCFGICLLIMTVPWLFLVVSSFGIWSEGEILAEDFFPPGNLIITTRAVSSLYEVLCSTWADETLHVCPAPRSRGRCGYFAAGFCWSSKIKSLRSFIDGCMKQRSSALHLEF